MASSAIALRESNLAVTCSAVLPCKKVNHAVLLSTLLDANKYIRMTHFAAVPDRMFLMGKNYLRDPFNLGSYGEILLVRHWRSFGGKTLDIVDQLYSTGLFSLLPVYAISAPLF